MMKITECDERFTGALAWSKLDPKPLLVYDSQTQKYLVCWEGILMPRPVALALAAKHILGIYPGPAVAHALNATLEKTTIIGIEGSVNYAIRTLREKIEDKKDVLRWFDKRNAMEI